jgi:hypothetical protein
MSRSLTYTCATHVPTFEPYARSGFHQECDDLDALSAIPTVDLFDESDEILRHQWQLIYACGSPTELSHGPTRWLCLQSILMAIKRDPAVKRALGETAIFGEAHPESFPPCRIVSDASMITTTKVDVYMAIVSYIFSQPPFELGWLRNYADRTDELFPFLVEPRVSMADLPPDIPANHRTTFLALRGFLACGVLLHVLLKRYDVEYGINPDGKKRLAVPFRANQTPAERAEYGHPDCAIALTTLAYHYRGLSLQQFTNALKVLLAYEDAAQNYFRDWVELSLPRMKQSGVDWESVQRVDQIDPQNHTQAKL